MVNTIPLEMTRFGRLCLRLCPGRSYALVRRITPIYWHLRPVFRRRHDAFDQAINGPIGQAFGRLQ